MGLWTVTRIGGRYWIVTGGLDGTRVGPFDRSEAQETCARLNEEAAVRSAGVVKA